jgi:hypothetical protein
LLERVDLPLWPSQFALAFALNALFLAGSIPALLPLWFHLEELALHLVLLHLALPILHDLD